MDPQILLVVVLVAAIANLVVGIVLVLRDPSRRDAELLRALREELRQIREDEAAAARALREELRQNREDEAAAARALRGELSSGSAAAAASAATLRDEVAKAQERALESLGHRMTESNRQNLAALETLRTSLAAGVRALQEGNEKKLEEMRVTVDEKLHGTLEKRLGESFKLVSDRLEAVQRGLGEMQSLASGVGDLKKVLTNVKLRGVWGEVQLRAILEQILTPEQYVENFQPTADERTIVEFAIRLPGRDRATSEVFLPIDAKFPQEDYLRLVEASESGESDRVVSATNALARAVRLSGQQIREKYLHPPRTTDFGILFLPTEGLYAEVLRQPGLVEELHLKCSVVVAGPTTLAAILNSLRMGFRTLAIEQRSSEVWKVLGAVKTEFRKFGDVLDRVKKQLATASNTIEETSTRTRAMERKLRQVEELPVEATPALPGFDELTLAGEDDFD